MYRSLALTVVLGRAEIGDEELVGIAKSLDINSEVLDADDEQIRAWVGGQDVTTQLWGKDVEDLVSKVASIPAVREVFTRRQRELSVLGGLILVGRDAGTTIVPEARVKFFLDANPNVRATRRAHELEQITGIPTRLEEVLQSLLKRDIRDTNRDISPLAKASDAIFIDTSDLDIDGVRRVAAPFIEELRKEMSSA